MSKSVLRKVRLHSTIFASERNSPLEVIGAAQMKGEAGMKASATWKREEKEKAAP